MKTIEEWYNELPEDVREKAINNTSESLLKERDESIEDALFGGFTWAETPEGHKYWENIKNNYLKQ